MWWRELLLSCKCLDVVVMFEEPLAPESGSSLPGHLIGFFTFASCIHTGRRQHPAAGGSREQLALGNGPKLPLPRQNLLFSVYLRDRDRPIKRDTEVSGWDSLVEECVCTLEHSNVLCACVASVVSNFSAQESSWQEGDNRIVGMVTDQ